MDPSGSPELARQLPPPPTSPFSLFPELLYPVFPSAASSTFCTTCEVPAAVGDLRPAFQVHFATVPLFIVADGGSKAVFS